MTPTNTQYTQETIDNIRNTQNTLDSIAAECEAVSDSLWLIQQLIVEVSGDYGLESKDEETAQKHHGMICSAFATMDGNIEGCGAEASDFAEFMETIISTH